jgi:hypothetical protein
MNSVDCRVLTDDANNRSRDIDILLAFNGEDSNGETMRLAWSLRRVPASQISLTAPHLHRLHIGPGPALGPCFRTRRIYDQTTRKASPISPA